MQGHTSTRNGISHHVLWLIRSKLQVAIYIAQKLVRMKNWWFRRFESGLNVFDIAGLGYELERVIAS